MLYTLPIVGAFYRPPAEAILKVLPVGAKLSLFAEPENPVDVNAIAVYVESSEIPPNSAQRLDEYAAGSGYSYDDIVAQESWHVGYIPAPKATALRESGEIEDNRTYSGEFQLSPRSSKPQISFSTSDLPQIVTHV